jgi:hypothetical protein
MNKLIKILRWPANYKNDYSPWPVIAWRALWMPLIYIGLAIAFIGVVGANGLKQAQYFWRNAA